MIDAQIRSKSGEVDTASMTCAEIDGHSAEAEKAREQHCADRDEEKRCRALERLDNAESDDGERQAAQEKRNQEGHR